MQKLGGNIVQTTVPSNQRQQRREQAYKAFLSVVKAKIDQKTKLFKLHDCVETPAMQDYFLSDANL